MVASRGKLLLAKNDFDWLMLPTTTMTSLLWHLIGQVSPAQPIRSLNLPE